MNLLLKMETSSITNYRVTQESSDAIPSLIRTLYLPKSKIMTFGHLLKMKDDDIKVLLTIKTNGGKGNGLLDNKFGE